jgi:triacylglycerol esterase/lipase EstA (alpha/beta hydrolase family)
MAMLLFLLGALLVANGQDLAATNQTDAQFPVLESPNGGPSQGLIGWMLKNSSLRNTSDISSQYEAAYNNIMQNGPGIVNTVGASNYVYVIVPGLLSKHYPGYMDSNVKALQACGLDVRRAPIDSDATVAVNAATIRATVNSIFQQTQKQIILFGHSKGCVDSAAAVSMYPDIVSKVKGLIAVQAPYGGSPIATDLLSSSPIKWVVQKIVQAIFKGDPQSIGDLSYASRQAFLQKYSYPPSVNTISVFTKSTRVSSLMYAAAKYISDSYGADNDGLVADPDAGIPSSRTVFLDNMDHGDTVFEIFKFCKYRPTQMSQALLYILLKR